MTQLTYAQRERLKSLARKAKQANATKPIDLLEGLFPEQLRFIQDPSKRKAALCSRRSGKTYACARYLLKTAYDHPGSLSAYLTLTRGMAKSLLWKLLKAFNRTYALGITFHTNDLTATLPNGSVIILTGADKEDEIDKLRGNAYHLVVLDECASIGAHVESLVLEVLSPALLDYGGTMVMIGTPGTVCSGLFHEVTTGAKRGANWATHRWTIRHNRELPEVRNKDNWTELIEGIIAEEVRQSSLSPTSAIYQREYLGEWVATDESLLFAIDDTRNTYERLDDTREWYFVFGIDFGTVDEFAIVVLAWSPESPNLYLEDYYKASGTSYREKCTRILDMDDTYHPTVIAADPSPGKEIIQDLSSQYQIPIQAAYKRDRLHHITILADEFASGRLKIRRDHSEIIDELRKLQWRDRAKGEVSGLDHIADALRYGYVESGHHRGVEPAKSKAKADPNEAWAERWATERESQLDREAEYQRLRHGGLPQWS